jgi:transcriptional regulator with XRE-family HTH domain
MFTDLYGASEMLRWLRGQEEISQAELAEFMGVTKSAVSAWECDKYAPSVDQLLSAFDAYGYELQIVPKDDAGNDPS